MNSLNRFPFSFLLLFILLFLNCSILISKGISLNINSENIIESKIDEIFNSDFDNSIVQKMADYKNCIINLVRLVNSFILI